jgi:DNA-binding NtrC family response regulator
MGVLERRRQFAGAARAAATLGVVLRERGDTARAESIFARAHTLFEGADPSDEDYIHAKVLLAAQRLRGRGDQTDRVKRAALRFLVDAAADLIRSCDGSDDGLGRLCSRVQRRVDATAVGLYLTGSNPSCVVSVGVVPRRVRDSLVTRVADGETVLASDLGRSTTASAVPIREDGMLVACLIAHWTEPPVVDDRPRIEAVLRLAALVSEPEVRYVVQRTSAACPQPANGIVGASREMAQLRASIDQVASCPYPVLIDGETGTGKELVARAVHRSSARRGGPFCAVNCAALTDELFEAELFGHARGAFTGAVIQRAGLFETAHRGTLFLDEVGELSPRGQAKLLRAVQEGEVRRLGDDTVRHVDVRIVAATNRGLRAEVAAGRFRQDLLFRLAVVRLQVPPLRVRGDDIRLLATQFWQRELTRTGGRAALAVDTLAALARYDWPGNVRELENVIAGLSVCAPRRGWARAHLLPPELDGLAPDKTVRATLGDARQAFERQFVQAALDRAAGRPGQAARELGVTRQGLAKLRQRLGLSRPGV